MVMAAPVASRSRRASGAPASVCSRRRRAAAARWWELSARIVVAVLAAARWAAGAGLAGLEGRDDSEQVGLDRSVHLHHAVTTVGLGLGDEAAGVGELLLVLR